MELNSPWVLLVGIIIIIASFFINPIKKGESLKTRKKIANTEYLKETRVYKTAYRRYLIIKCVILIACMISLFSALVLIAGPVDIKNTIKEEHKKDIFLCIDVSGSMNSINGEICKKIKSMVAGLKGDKFGIVLFNSSAVVAVPLTDDLHYVETVLGQLELSFDNTEKTAYLSNEEAEFYRNLKNEGTIDRPGSSIMSDALATCALDFPDLEEDRSRIIIFSTDNELAGTPYLTMAEACAVCSDNNIVVYSIGPANITDELAFTSAIRSTGGNVYKTSSTNSVDSIIRRDSKNRNQSIRIEKGCYYN